MHDNIDTEGIEVPGQPAATGNGGSPSYSEAESLADHAGEVPIYLDPATEQGLAELLEKVAPLIQGRRLHNIVDLLSLASDMVDMSDEAMVNKLASNYEQAVGGAWTVGNAARYAANEVSQNPTPSMFGLLRASRDEDVRRGLLFTLRFLGVLGKQMRPEDQPDEARRT